MLESVAYGFSVSVFVAGLAYWRGSLSRSGVVGALIVGSLILGLGGWSWGALLGFFFISSSLLSHFKEDEKKRVAEKFDKGHKRDFGQAMANGGLGALIAVLSVLIPSPIWFPLFIGVMATVNADTWATELGTLSKSSPRLITNGTVVEVGTSGGVTLFGSVVSFLGGVLVGLLAGWLGSEFSWWQGALIGGLGGIVGSFTDSFLGATVQLIYYSEQRQKETEKQFEKDGMENRPIRGWSWLNNDLVNLIASVVGGFVSLLVSLPF